MSGNGALSFDFSSVTVSGGLGIRDVPLDTDLYATVDNVTADNFNGQDKFVLEQTIYIDPDDESKTVNFKSFIGPNHGWLLAQYLAAVGEDFRSLSGQALTASALQTVLVGTPVTVRVKESKYTDRNGQPASSRQITTVRQIAKDD